jgi:hypothetical protein
VPVCLSEGKGDEKDAIARPFSFVIIAVACLSEYGLCVTTTQAREKNAHASPRRTLVELLS